MAIKSSEELKMRWTGHHLMDIGIATLCAMSQKYSPEELTMEDLDKAAEEMKKYYTGDFLISYLSCVFTMNAYYNPSSDEKKREEYAKVVLWGHRNRGDLPAQDHYVCPFSGEPATHFIDRRHLPLLSGDNTLNFYPNGLGNLPIFGPYLTALQALPLGSRRANGKLFAVYSDNSDLLIAMAEKYLVDNRRILSLAAKNELPQQGEPHSALIRETASFDNKKKPKYCDVKYPNTLLMNDLMEVNTEKNKVSNFNANISITAYHLSNSGQGPSIDLYYFPSGLIKFLTDVKRSKYSFGWQKLVNKGWHNANKDQKNNKTAKKTSSQGEILTGPGRSRNAVFEDLKDIFQHGFTDMSKASIFVKKHLLGDVNVKLKLIKEGKIDEESEESLVLWDLTKLFLTEVIGMNKSHLDSIMHFADKLAEYIKETNDKKFFRSIVYSTKSWELRNEMVKAQRNNAKDRNNLLFTFQEYMDVFMADESVGQIKWRDISDLISIRLIEQLFKSDYFKKNADLLSEDSDGSDDSQEN